jgi:hypothetical protein
MGKICLPECIEHRYAAGDKIMTAEKSEGNQVVIDNPILFTVLRDWHAY